MRAGTASRTAQHNALFRALESRRAEHERTVDDHLAVHFLPIHLRVLAELARCRPARRAIEAFIDRRWPGPRPGLVIRTRLFDDAVAAELSASAQVLILGAGFDTRAYRLPGMDDVAVFEVDHPSTQAYKRDALRAAIGGVPDNVHLVAVEFGSDDLEAAVRRVGFDVARRTVVLWEGVTNYLTADAVDATLTAVSAITPVASPLFMTYIDRAMLDGTTSFEGAEASSAHVARVGEPYTFGLHPPEVPGYLAARGFTLEWDIAVPDAAEELTLN